MTYGVSDYVLSVTGDSTFYGDVEVKGKLKGGREMMGLYEVMVVNKKRGTIEQELITAKGIEEARVKVLRQLTQEDFPDDDTTSFVREIGTWEDKKPREVKIVKE